MKFIIRIIQAMFFTFIVLLIHSCKKTPYNPIKDIDGNVYTDAIIGTQVWMRENLKTTTFNDNTPITMVTSNNAWTVLSSPAYSWYNNDISNKKVYGALYNWLTVSSNKLCPIGWHVPSDAEWTTLTDYLTNNGYGYLGSGDDIAKSMAATSGWTTYTAAGTVGNDQASNNKSGFSAIPGGSRSSYNGAFLDAGNNTLWWSSTEILASFAFYRYIIYTNSSILSNYCDKSAGLSVRCIKDN